MQKILVSYATEHGSTREIAEAISRTVGKHPFKVDCMSADTVKSLDDYDAVVFGSAVYVGAWTKDAIAFIKRFEIALQGRAVWFFSSGPTGEGEPSSLLQGWKYPDDMQVYFESIRPKGIKLFHGKLQLDSLSWFQRLLIKGIKAPVGDYRQWDEIQAWAEDIAQKLSDEEKQLMR